MLNCITLAEKKILFVINFLLTPKQCCYTINNQNFLIIIPNKSNTVQIYIIICRKRKTTLNLKAGPSEKKKCNAERGQEHKDHRKSQAEKKNVAEQEESAVSSQRTAEKRKSNSLKCKKYREQIKLKAEKKNVAEQEESDLISQHAAKNRKSNSVTCKEYRERKKSQAKKNHVVEQGESNLNSQRAVKNTKSNAVRCQEYRKRKNSQTKKKMLN